ncbi:hypothetical protein L1285_13940 [Pseudoalteromonas sp. DL2-H2.2]|uniref:Uncharacterized protein n=1 Tax=Pseudoalteromonas rubra TaxID=43658 RepID=A0A0F4QR65_9GAMM|nr:MULTISPECIES: hypothetical protein [Pseudoalteromonas]KJZ10186.1 hypothetical protein TW77_08130 [Pseudoalteromonas rubra]MCF2909421.1 hypothetical protein [Pseudoalteromonas sp. DL2-H2.2]
MWMLIFLSLAYMVIAGLIVLVGYKKSENISLKNKMSLRSGLLACFFSPAFIWVFPFSFPAPAIIAMALSVVSLFTTEPSRLMIGTLAFAFVPFLLFWLVYFGVYKLILRLRG